MCLRCGAAGNHLHHRRRRRDGGHDPQNLVTLCAWCHRDVHADPTRAKDTGYIVPALTVQAVADVALVTWAGPVRLTPDGAAHPM